MLSQPYQLQLALLAGLHFREALLLPCSHVGPCRNLRLLFGMRPTCRWHIVLQCMLFSVRRQQLAVNYQGEWNWQMTSRPKALDTTWLNIKFTTDAS